MPSPCAGGTWLAERPPADAMAVHVALGIVLHPAEGTTVTVHELDPHIAPELDRSVLVVTDTQVDFVDGGASPIPGTTEVLPAIKRLLDAYRAAALPIVHVVRLYDGDDVDLPRRVLIAAGAPIVNR